MLFRSCDQGHVFKGWFASENDYQSQRQSGLLACPLCGATEIDKRPSATRLNLGRSTQTAGQGAPDSNPDPAALQAAFLQAMRHAMRETENVGPRFAEEARLIHHGEARERPIRGQASPEETRALLEEGIPVLPLPLPPSFDNELQ